MLHRIGKVERGLLKLRHRLCFKATPLRRANGTRHNLLSALWPSLLQPFETTEPLFVYWKVVDWEKIALKLVVIAYSLYFALLYKGRENFALLLVNHCICAVLLHIEDEGSPTKSVKSPDIILLEVGHHLRTLYLIVVYGIFLRYNKGIVYKIRLV